MRQRSRPHATGLYRAYVKQVFDQIPGITRWQFKLICPVTHRLDAGLSFIPFLGSRRLRYCLQPSEVPDMEYQLFGELFVKFAES